MQLLYRRRFKLAYIKASRWVGFGNERNFALIALMDLETCLRVWITHRFGKAKDLFKPRRHGCCCFLDAVVDLQSFVGCIQQSDCRCNDEQDKDGAKQDLFRRFWLRLSSHVSSVFVCFVSENVCARKNMCGWQRGTSPCFILRVVVTIVHSKEESN